MNAIIPKNRDFFTAIAARTIETLRSNSKTRSGYGIKPPNGFKRPLMVQPQK